MKTDWQTKKLGNICTVGAGNSAPQKKEFFTNGKYPFFRTSDVGVVHIGKIDQSADYLNDKGVVGMRLFKKNTILFPKSGASTFLNHRVIMGVDGYASSHLATIKTDDSVLDSSYLFYFLQEIKAQDLIQDHKYPSLNLPVIEGIKISYPESLHEQKRIVKMLNDVFEKVAKAKENAEKNLQNAKGLFESYLQSVFANPGKDWEERRFDEVCVLQRGFDLPARLRKRGDHPLVSSNGITDSISLWKIKAPGVITGRSGTIGNVHFIEEDFWPLNTALYIKNFHGNDERFIFYFLKQFNLSKHSSGAGVPTLNRNNVHIVKVFVPKSLAEQKTIVKRLDALSAETKKLEKIYGQKLADLEELKKSVLQQAFTGKL